MTDKIRFLDDKPLSFAQHWVENLTEPLAPKEPCMTAKKMVPINVQPLRYAWVHKKRPSKIAGRRGTKRSWKQVNPSKFTKIADGPTRIMHLNEKMVRKILQLAEQ